MPLYMCLNRLFVESSPLNASFRALGTSYFLIALDIPWQFHGGAKRGGKGSDFAIFFFFFLAIRKLHLNHWPLPEWAYFKLWINGTKNKVENIYLRSSSSKNQGKQLIIGISVRLNTCLCIRKKKTVQVFHSFTKWKGL